MPKNAVLTSGGDSPGMNAAVTAIARAAALYNMPLIGVNRGFNGLLGKNPATDFVTLTLETALDIADMPGTQLRTARCVEFLELEAQQRAAKLLRDMDVAGLIVIGGDGSFRGAQALCRQGIPCVGIPGTIDNDLDYTEMTIGFDTAVNVCVEAVRSIRATSRSHDRPHVVEVMGRNSGNIALMTAAATGAEIVIAPDVDHWSVDEIAKRLQSQINKGNYRTTVIVAEGSWRTMEPFDVYRFLRPYGKEDVYPGEKMNAKHFASVLKRKCRMPDGSLPEARHTVVGYTQRGGQPTARDAAFALEAGLMAVNLLHKGESNKVIGMTNGQIVATDIDEALDVKRPFNQMLYNAINAL